MGIKALAMIADEKTEIVSITNSFVHKEVSPHYCQIMVAKRKRVDRLIPKKISTPEGVPLPFRRRGGDAGSPTKKIDFLVCFG